MSDPEFTSACVVVYDAEQISDPSGASVVDGQVTAEKPGFVTVTPTEPTETGTVFVTMKEYVITTPADEKVLGLADWTSEG